MDIPNAMKNQNGDQSNAQLTTNGRKFLKHEQYMNNIWTI